LDAASIQLRGSALDLAAPGVCNLTAFFSVDADQQALCEPGTHFGRQAQRF
jgi:hypothetical protein